MKLFRSVGIVLALCTSFAFAGRSSIEIPIRPDQEEFVPSNDGDRALKKSSKTGSMEKTKKKNMKGTRAKTNKDVGIDLNIRHDFVSWINCLADETSNKKCSTQDGVPEGYYFLDAFDAGLADCSTVDIPVRKCNVAVDPMGKTMTVVARLAFYFYDFDDDPEGGKCTETRPTGNELLYLKTNAVTKDFKYTQMPYAFVNGRSLGMEYFVDEEPYYFKSCPNKKQCCDDCDTPVCEDCDGVDAYPGFGYWVTDTSTWKPGEKRLYQWGRAFVQDGESYCFLGRVELTAVEKK